ncbi:TPA: MFS transporter, partial [Candidatus Bathyarchaeota archaeon]|nr:MFS transporter [Candidatus Bathyarchaeota archaeon]
MVLQDLKRLWFATLFSYAALGFISPLLPLYMSYRGLSPFEVGLVASLATLISILPVAMMGRISDIINREKLQGMLGVGLASVTLIYIYASSILHFMILHSAYMGLTYSYMTLSGAIAMDYIKTKRGTGFGKFRTSGSIGWIFGPFLGGLIADNLGFLLVFLSSSSFFLASALLFGIGGLRRRYAEKRESLNPSRHIEAFKRVLTNRAAYTLYASTFMAWISTPAYYTFLPLFMTDQIGTSRSLSSRAFSITPFAEVPAMLYLGSLSDSIGRKKVIALCLAAYPARYILTAFTGNPGLIIGVQLLHGLTFGGLYVVSVSYLSEAVDEDSKGL